MLENFSPTPVRPPAHRSLPVVLMVIAIMATTVIAGTTQPAEARNSTTPTGLPVYCLAPDGVVTPPPGATSNHLRPHRYVGLNSDPSEYVGDVIDYRTGVNYGPHPTGFGSMDEHDILTFTALDNPGSTTDQSHTGDIRFFGIAFWNESGIYTESPTPVFAMYIGPSRKVIEEECNGTFYDFAGHLRTANDIYWETPERESVPHIGHEYTTPRAMIQSPPRATASS